MSFLNTTIQTLLLLQQHPGLAIRGNWSHGPAARWINHYPTVIQFAEALEAHNVTVASLLDMTQLKRPDAQFRQLVQNWIDDKPAKSVHTLKADHVWATWRATDYAELYPPHAIHDMVPIVDSMVGAQYRFGTPATDMRSVGWVVIIPENETVEEVAPVVPAKLQTAIARLNTTTFYDSPSGTLWSFDDVVNGEYRVLAPVLNPDVTVNPNVLEWVQLYGHGYCVPRQSPPPTTDRWALSTMVARPTRDQARMLLRWLREHDSWVYLRFSCDTVTQQSSIWPPKQELDLTRYQRHMLYNSQWWSLQRLPPDDHADEERMDDLTYGRVRLFYIVKN